MIKKKYFYTLLIMNVILCFLVIYLLARPVSKVSASETRIVYITQETTTIIQTTEPIITQTETPPIVDPVIVEPPLRYNFTDNDIYLLAQLLCGDNKKSGDGEYDFVWNDKCIPNYYKEMSKVLCVVMNRQRSSRFPERVKDVILQKGQFSVIPNNLDAVPPPKAIDAIKEWCDLYNQYDIAAQVIPEDHLFFESGPNNTNITRKNWK